MHGDRKLTDDELAAIHEFSEGKGDSLLRSLGIHNGRISLADERVWQRFIAKLHQRNIRERRNIEVLRREGFLTERP